MADTSYTSGSTGESTTTTTTTTSDTTTLQSTPTFLSFPDNIKNQAKLTRNCLHFACVNPILKTNGTAMASSYRSGAINFSSAKMEATEKNLLDIYMYKPVLQTSLKHSYEAVEPSMIDNIMSAMMGALAPSPASNNAADVKTVSGGEAQGVGETVLKSVQGAIQKTAYEMANTSKAQTEGRMLITPQAQMYKGTTARVQNFTFKMTPRNRNDLIAMANIIYHFHYFSLPTRLSPSASGQDSMASEFGAYMYNVPKLWYIREMFGSGAGDINKRYTPRFVFGPAAITAIDYNMTPESYSKTLKGTAGDPNSIELSVTFTELVPLDSQMYDAQNKYTELHGIGPSIIKGE